MLELKYCKNFDDMSGTSMLFALDIVVTNCHSNKESID